MKRSSLIDSPDLYPKALFRSRYTIKNLLEELDNGDRAYGPEYHDIKEHANAQPQRPIVIWIGELGQSKIAEYEGLNQISNDLECDRCALLALRGEVVPRKLPHEDATRQQRHDARKVHKLSQHIGQVPKAEYQGALNDGVMC